MRKKSGNDNKMRKRELRKTETNGEAEEMGNGENGEI